MKTKTETDQEKLDQLAEEFTAHCRRGETAAVSDYIGRYPSLAGQLRELLPPIALIERLKSERHGPQPTTLGSQLPERIGDYRIVREVGRGGMGIVYEAEQESLGRRVALKILPRQSLLDPKRLGRFRREAQAAARLHHTNIVPVFGLCEQDGLLFYVMQYIQGQGLNEVLADLRRDPATRPTDPNNLPTLCFSDPLPDTASVQVALELVRVEVHLAELDSVEPSRDPPCRARLGIAGGPTSNLRLLAASCRNRHASGRSVAIRARSGDAAPRHQAGQFAARPPGNRLGHRFRSGQVARKATT